MFHFTLRHGILAPCIYFFKSAFGSQRFYPGVDYSARPPSRLAPISFSRSLFLFISFAYTAHSPNQ
jgi:hypothetical protein